MHFICFINDWLCHMSLALRQQTYSVRHLLDERLGKRFAVCCSLDFDMACYCVECAGFWIVKNHYILNQMEHMGTDAESMFFFLHASLLSPFQAEKHWHELYINLREWILFFFFFPFARFFFLFSLDRLLLWHIGSVRNERYSCRHAILVMKSQLDLLHDWFCNLLFSGSSQNEMMSCRTSFKYP